MIPGKVKRLVDGQVTWRGHKLPGAMLAGIVAVMLLYVGAAGIITATVPVDISHSGDTRWHIDYIWRTYNGEVPRLGDGMQYPPFVGSSGKRHFQPASNHPPLFYALNAPFVGPLLEKGEWKQAVTVARIINLFFGLLCIVALAWAGWLYGGRRGPLFAVAVPAVGVLAYRFTTLNVVYGQDTLLVLLATLTFVVIYKLIKHGLNTKYGIALAVLGALGMSTKAGYFAILVTAFAALLVAAWLHAKNERQMALLRAGLYIAAISLAVAIAVAWFYYLRNYKTTGTWFRASPDDYNGGREYKSLARVVFGAPLRELFYAKFAQNTGLSIALTSFVLAGYLGVQRLQAKKLFRDKTRLVLFGVLLFAVLIVLAAQVTFAVGYGAVNFRYMLPVLLPISLFLAYGLLEFKWARGQFIAGASILLGITTIFPAMVFLPGLSEVKPRLSELLAALAANGTSNLVLVALLATFALGAGLLVVSLYKLSVNDRANV